MVEEKLALRIASGGRAPPLMLPLRMIPLKPACVMHGHVCVCACVCGECRLCAEKIAVTEAL